MAPSSAMVTGALEACARAVVSSAAGRIRKKFRVLMPPNGGKTGRRLLGGHANRSIQADDGPVQHRIFNNLASQLGIFVRTAEARREGNGLAERQARGLGQPR